MESRTVAINGASSPLLLVCLNVSRGSDHYLYTSQISRLAVGHNHVSWHRMLRSNTRREGAPPDDTGVKGYIQEIHS